MKVPVLQAFRPLAFLSISLLASLAPFSPLAAAPVESPTQQIARAEEAYSQSFVTGDVRIAERVVAADFVGFEPDGTTSDKAGILADVRSGPAQRP